METVQVSKNRIIRIVREAKNMNGVVVHSCLRRRASFIFVWIGDHLVS